MNEDQINKNHDSAETARKLRELVAQLASDPDISESYRQLLFEINKNHDSVDMIRNLWELVAQLATSDPDITESDRQLFFSLRAKLPPEPFVGSRGRHWTVLPPPAPPRRKIGWLEPAFIFCVVGFNRKRFAREIVLRS
jgi:hypothetical protein